MPDKPKASKAPPKALIYGVGTLVGVGALYYLYKRYQASSAANALTGGAGTAATTTPAASTTIGTGIPPQITNLQDWRNAILYYMTTTFGIKGGENVAATGLTSALSGHCLGPNEYAALNAALAAVGQPPGGAVLRISQCKSRTPGNGGTTTTTHTPTSQPKPGTQKTPAPKAPKPKPVVKIPNPFKGPSGGVTPANPFGVGRKVFGL